MATDQGRAGKAVRTATSAGLVRRPIGSGFGTMGLPGRGVWVTAGATLLAETPRGAGR
jgi:hypothetical protein